MAKKERKRSKFPWLILIILILALVLAWKFGLLKGFGLGSGLGLGNDTQNAEETQSISTSEEQTTVASQEIHIEVAGDQYLWNGEEVTLDTIKTNLDALEENTKVILTDNEAVQNAYQEVLDVLNESSIQFDQVNK